MPARLRFDGYSDTSECSIHITGIRNSRALNLGGSIATAGGLVFIAATNDKRFRAFGSKTGRLLWEQPIDSNGHAIPITYFGRDGKQYVVIMAGGGGGKFGTPPSDSVTAFALADGAPRREVSAVQGTGQVGASTAAPSARLPDATGKAIVQRSCGSQCHNLDVVTSQRLTRQEWKIVVDAMAPRPMGVNRQEGPERLRYNLRPA